MPRTLTKPPTDSTMWRRLAARGHPDAGGDHDLFIWVANVRELVCGGGFEGAGIPYTNGGDRTGPAYGNGSRSYSTGATGTQALGITTWRATRRPRKRS